MNYQRVLTLIICVLLCGQALAQDIDTELSGLAEKLAAQIKEQGKKKVTVIDFTDLQGGSSELGKYIAEQLIVDLVMNRKDFSVLDRANLRSILAEHKLTAKGLVDPDTAKQLGKFAGVDAIILGTITPKDQNITLTAKIITTDTAEIVGAAKAAFKSNDTVHQLLASPATESGALSGTGGTIGTSGPADLSDDKPKVIKTFGNLAVELQSLRIVNGSEYLLTMTLTNRSTKDSLWVALTTGNEGNTKASLLDPNGSQFVGQNTTGISYAILYSFSYYATGAASRGSLPSGNFRPSTEIKASNSVTTTITFTSPHGARPAPGLCNLQIEFVVGNDLIQGAPERSASPNLITKFEAK